MAVSLLGWSAAPDRLSILPLPPLPTWDREPWWLAAAGGWAPGSGPGCGRCGCWQWPSPAAAGGRPAARARRCGAASAAPRPETLRARASATSSSTVGAGAGSGMEAAGGRTDVPGPRPRLARASIPAPGGQAGNFPQLSPALAASPPALLLRSQLSGLGGGVCCSLCYDCSLRPREHSLPAR